MAQDSSQENNSTNALLFAILTPLGPVQKEQQTNRRVKGSVWNSFSLALLLFLLLLLVLGVVVL